MEWQAQAEAESESEQFDFMCRGRFWLLIQLEIIRMLKCIPSPTEMIFYLGKLTINNLKEKTGT